jgi:hypothetical protein
LERPVVIDCVLVAVFIRLKLASLEVRPFQALDARELDSLGRIEPALMGALGFYPGLNANPR